MLRVLPSRLAIKGIRSGDKHAICCRSWSSSPSRLKSGVSTVATAVKRVMDNAEPLSKYEKDLQLFSAGTNPARLWWTMVQLHMPAETQVELQEFLEGAKTAVEVQLKAVNSKEFGQFAAGLTPHSAIAKELQDYCTPRFFDDIKEAAAVTREQHKMTLELQDITIEDAVVVNVQYAQLTQTQYDAQMAGLAKLPLLWSNDASIEYMQIHMMTRSSETTRMTLIGQEECLALQDNTRTWAFGSKVGSPEELEWRMLDTVAVNNAAKQLSRTVFADASTSDEVTVERGQKV